MRTGDGKLGDVTSLRLIGLMGDIQVVTLQVSSQSAILCWELVSFPVRANTPIHMLRGSNLPMPALLTS